MHNPEQVVTMRALAQKLELSVMTVSRALRNATGVSAETRQKVIAASRALHYQPDPAFAVLNEYRHGRRARPSLEPLAFITNFPTPDAWRKSKTFARYFEGAARQAARLGYTLTPFWLGEPGLTGKRASQILRGRGIRGIIIGPLSKGESELELDWDRFSAVSMGRSLTSPEITQVSTNHYQAVEEALFQARQLGYSRIGFAITEYEDLRTAGGLRASFLLAQAQSPDLVPAFVTSEFSESGIQRWAEEHRPQMLMASEPQHHELLKKSDASWSKPTFLHLNLDPGSDAGGIDQGHDLVAEHAVGLLHLKLIQREAGVPDRRDLLLINGVWRNGRGEGRIKRRNSRG